MRVWAVSAHLAGLPLVRLRAGGVEGLLLDLDNTLVPARSTRVPLATAEFLQALADTGLRAVIVSNGSRRRSAELGALLGLPAVDRAKKPLQGGYRRALEILGLPSQKVAAVGDQFLTDGVGGLCLGVPVFLVEPLSPTENLLVRAARPLDRALRHLLVEAAPPGACLTTTLRRSRGTSAQ